MKHLRTIGALLAVGAFAVLTGAVVSASGPLYYTGQGFTNDGTTWSLNSQRCGLDGQGVANDGGTGQFASNGFVPGNPYLVWVLTANGASSAKLFLPDEGFVEMIKVGGTFKYASKYYSPTQIIGEAFVTWTGGPKKAQLVVSHGCPPRVSEGGWCSPGFWMNATDAAWKLTNYRREDFFNATVVPNYYNEATMKLLPYGPTLDQVLTTPGANTYGKASAPLGMNAFNATGAFLTDRLAGGFDPAKDGVEGTCQIDHHGNYKP